MVKTESSLSETLLCYIKDILLDGESRTQKFDRRTVGIEHEFFLTTENGQPCTFLDSQNFLKGLQSSVGWKEYRKPLQTDNQIIERVSFQHLGGRYTAIKYEYSPHLMEVAFSFFDSLHELNEEITKVFEVIHKTARNCGLNIKNRPFQDWSAATLVPQCEDGKNLLHSRQVLFRRRGVPIDFELANFTSVTAATQTHIGGLNWWRNPDLVNSLYCLEPLIAPFSAILCVENLKDIPQLLRRRWEGYLTTFSGLPLVGYPDLPCWNLREWAIALTKSPLIGRRSDSWVGLTPSELANQPFDCGNLLRHIRDVQLIRPKLFGTLEFRADPAQPSASHILAVAAVRLGAVEAVLRGLKPKLSFREARKLWQSQAAGNVAHFDKSIVDVLSAGLVSRGLGEEHFLGPINGKLRNQAA